MYKVVRYKKGLSERHFDTSCLKTALEMKKEWEQQCHVRLFEITKDSVREVK